MWFFLFNKSAFLCCWSCKLKQFLCGPQTFSCSLCHHVLFLSFFLCMQFTPWPFWWMHSIITSSLTTFKDQLVACLMPYICTILNNSYSLLGPGHIVYSYGYHGYHVLFMYVMSGSCFHLSSSHSQEHVEGIFNKRPPRLKDNLTRFWFSTSQNTFWAITSKNAWANLDS